MQLTVARLLTAVTAVLGDVGEADGKALALELTEFMKQLGPKEAGALEMKTKFQKLADDVKLFNAKIDVELAKADAKIKADLENARTRVKSLTQELEAYVFAFPLYYALLIRDHTAGIRRCASQSVQGYVEGNSFVDQRWRWGNHRGYCSWRVPSYDCPLHLGFFRNDGRSCKVLPLYASSLLINVFRTRS